MGKKFLLLAFFFIFVISTPIIAQINELEKKTNGSAISGKNSPIDITLLPQFSDMDFTVVTNELGEKTLINSFSADPGKQQNPDTGMHSQNRTYGRHVR